MTTICPECNQPLSIGDFPFCPHGPMRDRHAQAFDPIVVHRDAAGNYSFPGHSSDPVPEGYEKVELRTIREADAFCRQMNTSIRAQRLADYEQEYGMFQERVKQTREGVRERLASQGITHSDTWERVKKYVDEKRYQKYTRMMAADPNFNLQILSRDASNRPAYHDEKKTVVSVNGFKRS